MSYFLFFFGLVFASIAVAPETAVMWLWGQPLALPYEKISLGFAIWALFLLATFIILQEVGHGRRQEERLRPNRGAHFKEK